MRERRKPELEGDERKEELGRVRRVREAVSGVPPVKTHPGEGLPLLLEQPLNDAALQHVQVLALRPVEDDHEG